MSGISLRQDEHRGPEARHRADGPEAADLEALRQSGEDLLSAADEEIRRALSRDSAAFLRANRQGGGQ